MASNTSLPVPNTTSHNIAVSNQSFVSTLRTLSEKKEAITKTAGVNGTISANDLVRGKTILLDAAGANINLTFPDAADLVSTLELKQTNQSLQFYIRNTGATGTISLVNGTGVTISPAGVMLHGGEMAVVQVFFSNVTSGAEAAAAHIFTGTASNPASGTTLSLLNTVINVAQRGAEEAATTTLTTTGAGDLAAAITAASDGDVIEIQTNATYTGFTIPSATTLVIRAGYGYHPVITDSQACQLSDGAANVILIGLTFDACDLGAGNVNYQGSCVTFATQNARVENITFYQCQFINIADVSASAIMLSYHWSVGGDQYFDPPQPDELSTRVAFMDCYAYHACTDGIEGAAFNLRAVRDAVFYRCDIDGDAANVSDSRGIQLQNCPDAIISHCHVHDIGDGGGNNEGIKLNAIGSPTAVFGSGVVQYNTVQLATEGIDIDDDVQGAVVYGNKVRDCSTEGISIDGGAPEFGIALVLGNKCYNNDTGIFVQAGGLALLHNNHAFFNTTSNYDPGALAADGNLENYSQDEESYGSFELGASGGITAVVTDGLSFAKQGPVVRLTFRAITEDGSGGGAIISLTADAGNLPPELRPSASVATVVQVVDNAAEAVGLLEVQSDGSMALYDGVDTSGGTFAGGAGATGLPRIATVTYVIDA